MQHVYENVDLSKIKPIQKMSYQNRVNYFRTARYQTIVSRMVEILPYFITYDNLPITISALQIESAMRISNQDLVIGLDRLGQLVVLGRPVGIVNNYYNYPLVSAIDFIIPKEQQLPREQYVQILPTNPKVGNYILLRNRFNPVFKTDLEIIEEFAVQLAELAKSRYSLSIQSSVLTYFKGVDVSNNNTINKIMDDMYEGAPFIKVESNLNLQDDFGIMENASVIPPMLMATKTEYDNVMNEMLNLTGNENLGVNKASGVSEFEATANTGLSKSIQNIYIKTRQESFNLLSHRFPDIIGEQGIVVRSSNLPSQEVKAMIESSNEEFVNTMNSLNQPQEPVQPVKPSPMGVPKKKGVR